MPRIKPRSAGYKKSKGGTEQSPMKANLVSEHRRKVLRMGGRRRKVGGSRWAWGRDIADLLVSLCVVDYLEKV